MDSAAYKLALFWLNSLIDVPSALLVNSLDELSDGVVLGDVARYLQRLYDSHSFSSSSKIHGIPGILDWLTETFGFTILPTELSSPGAIERIRSGHVLTIAALINFMKHRIDELQMMEPSTARNDAGMFLRKKPAPLRYDMARTEVSGMTRSIEPAKIQANAKRAKSPHVASYNHNQYEASQFSQEALLDQTMGMNVTVMDSAPPVARSLKEMLERIKSRQSAESPPPEIRSSRAGHTKEALVESKSEHRVSSSISRPPLATPHAPPPSKPLNEARTVQPAPRMIAVHKEPSLRLQHMAASSTSTPKHEWNASTLPSKNPSKDVKTLRHAPSVRLVAEQKVKDDARRPPVGVFMHGSLIDPTYQPKVIVHEETKPKQQRPSARTTVLQQPSSASIRPIDALHLDTATKSSSPPTQHHATLPPSPTSTETSLQPDIVSKHPPAEATRERKPLERYHHLCDWFTALKLVTLQDLPLDNEHDFEDAILQRCSNGIALSELAAVLGTRTGARVTTMTVRIRGQQTQVVSGTVIPKGSQLNAAAASKNLDLALSVFRDNPKVHPRYLWCDDDIRTMADVNIVIGLLESIHRAFPTHTPAVKAHKTTRFVQPPAPPSLPEVKDSKMAITSTTTFIPELGVAQKLDVLAEGHLLPLQAKPSIVEEEPPPSVPSTDNIAQEPPVAMSKSMLPPRKIVKRLPILAEPVAVPQEVIQYLPSTALALQARGLLQSARLSKFTPPVAMEYDEGKVRAWLQDVGVSDAIAANPHAKRHVLDDPLLNGKVIVEVVKRLEPDAYPLSGPDMLVHYAKPKSLAEARANIEAALSVLRASPAANGSITLPITNLAAIVGVGGRRHIPEYLLWCCEELLVGNSHMAWALLDEIRQQYQWVNRATVYNQQRRSQHAAQMPPGEVYPEEAHTAASEFVMTFLRSPPRSHANLSESFVVDGRKDVARWLKSVDLLPQDMRDDVVWTAEGAVPSVCSGKMLAQIHELISGETVKGVVFPSTTATLAKQNLEKCIRALGTNRNMSTRVLTMPNVAERVLLGDLQVIEMLLVDCMRCYRFEPPIPASPRKDIDLGKSIIPYNSTMPTAPEVPLPPSPPPTDVATERKDFGVAKEPAALLQMPSPPRPIKATQASTLPAATASASTALVPVKATTASVAPAPQSRAGHEVSNITTWLAGLGIEIRHPEALAGSKPGDSPCAEFMDGLLLVRVVEACENLRGSLRGGIAGIEKYPRSAAAKLANIRRALEVLRLNRSMPLDYLWSELAIRDGAANVIRGLLLHIRKAYGFASD